MSGGETLKRAIVATLCEHPDAKKYHEQTFDNVDALVGALAQRLVLTKADFMERDEAGKCFLDSPGAWKNFDKIAAIVALSGEHFTYDDFMGVMTPETGRTLLDSAKSNGSLAKVFTFDVWEGRFDEMEKLWYQLAAYDRNKALQVEGAPTMTRSSPGYGLIPLPLKKRLLEAEGRTAPEERLAKAGLSLEDIRKAATDHNVFENVNRKLRQAGDHFRKEYAMMLDSEGDTMFDGREGAWDNFGKVVSTMAAHGERFEVEDYLRQVSSSKSLLGRAAEKRVLEKIFAPEQWVDRLPEMLDLWLHVLDGWKVASMKTQDFDNAYAAAEGMTYGKAFTDKTFEGKGDLFERLNENPDEKPVIPLGLKVVWENIDAVQARLREAGEPLTLSDLRRPSGQMGDSCLLTAAKYGKFGKVVDIARQNGEQITLQDFQTKDAHGNTLLDILCEKKQLSLVFDPDAWAGHIADMRALWAQVGTSYRKQVDFEQVEIQTQQSTLRQKKGGGFKFRPHG